jgi:S-adenosyl-L-methionine hydrolase (adenosine-forming)
MSLPIFLLTDFGTRDAYVGQVKAVIAGIAPGAPVIDLSHEVAPFDIEHGAWLLDASLPFLPERAVVMAVVDPGVGSARKELVAPSGGRFFVGPDNGVLSSAFPEEVREGQTPGALDVRELCEPQFRRTSVSATFHGRDIFAPAAAHLANGVDYRFFGPPVPAPVILAACCGQPAGLGELRGRVIHIDRYGNLITTIHSSQLFPRFSLDVAGHTIDTHVRTFSDAPEGLPFCHVDSSGYVAVAVNRGSAARELGIERNDPVTVRAR